jgi:hypothetical protein
VSHENPHTAYLSLRIPHRLAVDLKRAAVREGNTQSSVVRRLIALGLRRERQADRRETSEGDGE